ncbi:MAG: hypothetical protein Q9160_003196 [Pyrenula sp. 1 TL-2023]
MSAADDNYSEYERALFVIHFQVDTAGRRRIVRDRFRAMEHAIQQTPGGPIVFTCFDMHGLCVLSPMFAYVANLPSVDNTIVLVGSSTPPNFQKPWAKTDKVNLSSARFLHTPILNLSGAGKGHYLHDYLVKNIMARTRAQGKARVGEKPTSPAKQDTKKRSHSKTQEAATPKNQTSKKPKTESKPESSPRKTDTNAKSYAPNPKIRKLLSSYGSTPLSSTTLSDPSDPSASTLLAHLLNALLSSARISYDLAAKTVATVIRASWYHLDVLKATSWEERTKVLTEGGYTRYREKTATGLGELVEFLESRYDGDLNNLLASANSSPPKVRQKLKEIKGLGDVGADIFFDTTQGLWACLAPFLDPRSLKTVEAMGISGDDDVLETLWKEVGEDPARMAELASAITRVRLEGREGEFKD